MTVNYKLAWGAELEVWVKWVKDDMVDKEDNLPITKKQYQDKRRAKVEYNQ